MATTSTHVDAPAARGTSGRSWRLAPPALVVLGWLAALPLVGDYGNPDGPSYAIVARLWLQGSWADAVNAYWGPLLSWLAVPFLAVGVPDLLALRVVLLLGALACLVPLRALAHRAGAGERATDLALVATAPLLVYAASFGLYADVLMAGALLRSLELATRREVREDPWLLVRAGAWAGVAYLARAYAVPVVLVSIPLIALTHVLTSPEADRRLARAVRHAAMLLAGFALVGGSWAVVLSLSEGEPTFSTSAGFNADLVAPGSAGNPFNRPGLHEPVRAGGLSGWEEPSQLPIPLRSDAGSAGTGGELGERDASQRAELAVANARIAVGSVLRRGAPLALLAALALAAVVGGRRRASSALFAPLLTGAVAAGGLLAIIAIERYLWFPILAAVPAAALGLDVVLARSRRLGLAVGAATILLMVLAAAHGLLPRVGAHEEVTVAAATLEDTPSLGRVATIDSWQRSHLLCFHTDCTYLGRPDAETVAAVGTELRAADVDHLLVWGDDVRELPGLAEHVDRRSDLTILRVTADGFEPHLVFDDLP
ncbi:MAG: hypothetical protein WEB09_00515 [Nitriliruptor sp.]